MIVIFEQNVLSLSTVVLISEQNLLVNVSLIVRDSEYVQSKLFNLI